MKSKLAPFYIFIVVLFFNCGVYDSEQTYEWIKVSGIVKSSHNNKPIASGTVSLSHIETDGQIFGSSWFVTDYSTGIDSLGNFSLEYYPDGVGDRHVTIASGDYYFFIFKFNWYSLVKFKVYPGDVISGEYFLDPTARVRIHFSPESVPTDIDSFHYGGIYRKSGYYHSEPEFEVEGNKYYHIGWRVKKENQSWISYTDSIYCPFLKVTEYTIDYNN